MECLIGIGTSIAETIAENTVNAVGRQIGYCISYKTNVEDLRTQIEDLKLAKERVDHSVSEARNKCGIIEGDVQHWLSKANSVSGDAAKLLRRDEVQANNCFSRVSFSRLIKRYKLSKEAKKTVDVIADTVEQAKTLGKVSYRLPPSNSLKIKGYEDFETRAHVFEEIMEALKDVRVRTIGVWGMGGVGKTMLVQAIASQGKSENLFTHVILTTISQTPDYRRIQEEVAEALGLELNENTVALRAKRLRDRLSSENKILIILDDVWSKLDLADIGIVSADDQNECKILLTSRSQDVLCNEMSVDRSFNLGVLSEFEATDLFDQIAGDLAQEQEFQIVKKKILQKCAGLPLAISIVAKALKDKSLSIWEDAWQELRTSNPANIKGVEKEVYSVIRWSYDFLQSEEAKSLLVLCSIHEEDEEINVDALLMYCMGLRFFHGIRKIKDARNRVFQLVETLKSSSLLLDGNDDNNARMHDVTRDVILSIASKDRHVYFVRNIEELDERINNNELEDSTVISLSSSNNMILERLPCPKLQMFSLSQECRSKSKISNQFFELVRDLKVLGLKKVDLNLASLSSFCFLGNLKTLTCIESSLGDIASIGQLKCLEFLDLSRSSFKMVPKELRNLTRLLSLDLSYCENLKVIEAGVISSFKRLEELSVTGTHFTCWASLTDETCSNARLTELEELSHITTLYLDILDANNVLPDEFFVDKLEIFQLRVTSRVNHTFRGKERFSRSLILEKVNDSLLERSCLKQLINRAENLSMKNMNIKNSFSEESGEEGDLKVLTMYGIQTVGYVINTYRSSSMSYFRNLGKLYLADLEKLETICNGGNLSPETLAKLRVVDVRRCHALKNLFPVSFSFPGLEKLKVFDCEALECIFMNINSGDEVIEFPRLHTVKLKRLPKLKQFYVGLHGDDGHLPLFHHNVAFPALKILKLEALDSNVLVSKRPSVSASFRKLEKIEVTKCSSLKSLFSASVAKALPELESIRLVDCDQLQEIIAEEEGASEIVPTFVFPRLSSLYFYKLPELQSFYRNRHCSEWPYLGELTLEKCGKVKILASQLSSAPLFYIDTNVVAFPKLKKIDLRELDHLEMLWQSEQELSRGSFGELEWLTIKYCDALEKLFSHTLLGNLGSLTALKIENCAKVEEVFEMQRPNSVLKTDKIVFIRMTSLILDSLPNFKQFFAGSPAAQTRDDRLANADVIGCDRVPLFHHKVAFPALSELSLKKLDSLEMIWLDAEHELASDNSFSNLEQLEIDDCKKLTRVCSSIMLGRLRSLTDLRVEHCDMMEEVIEIRNPMACKEIILNCPISSLTLSGLQKLKHVLSYKDQQCPHLAGTSVTFNKLKKVKVFYCSSLINLFPTSVAKKLFELESIDLTCCPQLRELIAKEEGSEEKVPKFVFPRLSKLYISNFPELECIYHDLHCCEFPALGELTLHFCGKVKMLASQMSSYRENMREATISANAPLFLVEKVAFPRLKEMRLDLLDQLKMIWQADQELIPGSFGELETITIGRCNALIKLFSHNLLANPQSGSPSFSFPKLEKVDVIGCHNLKSLFPASYAKDLLELKYVNIRDCNQIQEIIACEKESPELILKFDFRRLIRLSLTNLPELKCLYPNLHTSNWPSLSSLILNNCYNVKILASQLSTSDARINTPLVAMETVTFPMVIHESLDVSDSGDHIERVDELPYLKRFFFPSSASFKNLSILFVLKCGFTGSLLDPSTAKSLPQLESLVVAGCNNMTEVIADALEKGKIVFSKLRNLVLALLPKIVSFHSGSYALAFPSLATFIVSSALRCGVSLL